MFADRRVTEIAEKKVFSREQRGEGDTRLFECRSLGRCVDCICAMLIGQMDLCRENAAG